LLREGKKPLPNGHALGFEGSRIRRSQVREGGNGGRKKSMAKGRREKATEEHKMDLFLGGKNYQSFDLR